MSIEHLDRIDAISINSDQMVILSIPDHLDWDNEQLHSTMLQDKNICLPRIYGKWTNVRNLSRFER